MFILFLFFVLISIIGILFFLSLGKYDDLIKTHGKEQSKIVKMFLPIGFYILDMTGYKYNTRYDKALLSKLTELYGVKSCIHKLKIHLASKIAIVLFGIIVVMLIGMGIETVSGKEGGPDIAYVVFCILFITAIVILHDRELEKKLKERRFSINMDFPGFLNKLMLLINAGLTIKKAWEKIALENTKNSDFYMEVSMVIYEINSGKPELKAYEDFARRCRTTQVSRFVAILLQNIRKGNEEMVSILRVLSNECWDLRKNAVRKICEEASVKMILPLMLMFIAILIIVASPAILALSAI